MRKTISVVLIVASLTLFAIPAYAKPTNVAVFDEKISAVDGHSKYEATILHDGEKTIYSVIDYGSYRIAMTQSSDGIYTADSRNNYVEHAGEKFYYTTSQTTRVDNDSSGLSNIVTPNATYDEYGVDTSIWGYIATSESLTTFQNAMSQLTYDVIMLAITKLYPIIGLAQLATDAYIAFRGVDQQFAQSQSVYTEQRRYGYRAVMSQFAFVYYSLTAYRTPIPNTISKYNPTPYYPF